MHQIQSSNEDFSPMFLKSEKENTVVDMNTKIRVEAILIIVTEPVSTANLNTPAHTPTRAHTHKVRIFVPIKAVSSQIFQQHCEVNYGCRALIHSFFYNVHILGHKIKIKSTFQQTSLDTYVNVTLRIRYNTIFFHSIETIQNAIQDNLH